jgi:hypothetical protein
VAALVAAGTFLLYLGTLIPEVGWGDSAELSLVSYQVGITHPPGYPLHAILGKLVSIFFADPAVGVNLLSAICTSLAAGVLSLIIFELTAMPLIAASVAIVFSVLPNVWEMAVVAEVYNVNIFFLGCSIYLFIRAERFQFTKLFIQSAIFFGLSLGTYQANLLLLPAFLLAIILSVPREKVLNSLAVYCSTIGIICIIFLLFSVLRSRALLAINYPLNSFQEVLNYATGAGLRPPYPKNIAFYVERTMEHARIFSTNFLFLSLPVGLLGLLGLLKQKRTVGLFLGIAFGINFLFFTYYSVSDYFTMPTPAYFIFSIFIGYGLAVLPQNRLLGNPNNVELAAIILCALIIGVQLVNQLPPRLERANTYPVTELLVPALNAFPKNAIVISRWERYAPLLYFQHVGNLREDVTLVESDDFLGQISSYSLNSPDRSILIDNHGQKLSEKYQINRYYRRWFLIVAPVDK